MIPQILWCIGITIGIGGGLTSFTHNAYGSWLIAIGIANLASLLADKRGG